MKLTTSFFNPGIWKQDFRQHGWLGLLFLIGLLFIIPIRMIMLHSESHTEEIHHRLVHMEHLFVPEFGPQFLLIAIIPVLTGIFIFRYLQVKEAADMIHSLPATRGTLYVNHVLSGLTLLLVPIWITAMVTLVVLGMLPEGINLSTSEVLEWALIVTLFSSFLYVFSILVGMMTGISVVQGILIYIFLLLPTGLMLMLNTHLNYYLYGFFEIFAFQNIVTWSPLLRLVELGRVELTAAEIIVYIGLTLLIVYVAYGLYRLRHIETATQSISFQLLKPIFKYGVTFCSMLLVGMYFAQDQHLGWAVFGYVVGSLIGYFVAEMILQKTWRIFNPKVLVGYIGYAIVMAIILVAVQMDVTGYETRVPETENIEGVYFGDDLFRVQQGQTSNGTDVFTDDEAYIEKVKAFHEDVVHTQPEAQSGFRAAQRYVLAYQLESGNQMIRQYDLPQDLTNEEVEESLQEVLDSEGYKRQQYHLQQLEGPIQQFVMRPVEPVHRQVIISNPQEVEEVQQLLEEEVLAMSDEQVSDDQRIWAHIEVVPDRTEQRTEVGSVPMLIDLHKSFERLELWLAWSRRESCLMILIQLR